MVREPDDLRRVVFGRCGVVEAAAVSRRGLDSGGQDGDGWQWARLGLVSVSEMSGTQVERQGGGQVAAAKRR